MSCSLFLGFGLSEIWTHKDSSSRHLANALLHLWRSVLFGGHKETWTPIKQLEVAGFTFKRHAPSGSRKIRTSNQRVKSSLLYHWAIHPLSELDSNKHRTLPKNGDLPISRSLILARFQNRTKIYYLQDSRTNHCTNQADLHGDRTHTTTVKEWGADHLHQQILYAFSWLEQEFIAHEAIVLTNYTKTQVDTYTSWKGGKIKRIIVLRHCNAGHLK